MNMFRISVSEIKTMTPETAGRHTSCNLALPAGGIRRPHPRLIIWGRGCGNAWSLADMPPRLFGMVPTLLSYFETVTRGFHVVCGDSRSRVVYEIDGGTSANLALPAGGNGIGPLIQPALRPDGALAFARGDLRFRSGRPAATLTEQDVS